MNQALHPVFAGILRDAASIPAQLRRAEYVSRLLTMDWEFEHAASEQWRIGRDELACLRRLQVEVDPTAALWNKHAPDGYKARQRVKVAITHLDGRREVTWVTSQVPDDVLINVFLGMHSPITRIEVSKAESITAPALAAPMTAPTQQAKVREYLRTHDVDASGCDTCDAMGGYTINAKVDDSPYTVPAHVECEACEGTSVVGVDAQIVREALQ